MYMFMYSCCKCNIKYMYIYIQNIHDIYFMVFLSHRDPILWNAKAQNYYCDLMFMTDRSHMTSMHMTTHP